MSGCYVEAFTADGKIGWGWQCFTCPDERDGYPTLQAAEDAGEHHRVEVATEQLIEAGELP